jgi:hypothetical protein
MRAMEKFNLAVFLLLITFVALIGIAGCLESDGPDLIPFNPKGMVNFCDTDGGGNLVVTVKNQGNADAGSSHVRVTFGQAGEFLKPIPPLAVNETATVIFEIPSGAYKPDLFFKIEVDALNEVKERNEGNNVQDGSCLG